MCLVLLQLATAADRREHAAWRNIMIGNDFEDRYNLRSTCRLWWTPRSPPLPAYSPPATFQLEFEVSAGLFERCLHSCACSRAPYTSPLPPLSLAAAAHLTGGAAAACVLEWLLVELPSASQRAGLWDLLFLLGGTTN